MSNNSCQSGFIQNLKLARCQGVLGSLGHDDMTLKYTQIIKRGLHIHASNVQTHISNIDNIQ